MTLRQSVDRRVLLPIPITARDAVVMHFLKEATAAPVDVLASRFFARNDVTGATNENPIRAARRRLDELARAAYLFATSVPPSTTNEWGGRVYVLGAAGAKAVGVKTRGTAPKLLHNHLQTLRALEQVRLDSEGCGRSVAGFELRRGPLANEERLSGRLVPSGFLLLKDGNVVVVVYVSAHVGDAKLHLMHDCFGPRHQVRWFSNSAATGARVAAITGAPCDTVVAEG
jgi:hypothetical protein